MSETEGPSTEGSSFWTRWFPIHNIAFKPSNRESDASENDDQESNFARRFLPSWILPVENVKIDDSTVYHQLTKKQKALLESEARQGISKKYDTWCWFKDFTTDDVIDSNGELSVYNTGCANCPLPLNEHPLFNSSSKKVFILRNSLLLPGISPSKYYHELPLRTKLANAVRAHYNYDSERHLYLKKHPPMDFSNENIAILSLHGSLPEKYEKLTIDKLPHSIDVSEHLLKLINQHNPRKILTFSLECPLDLKPIEQCLEECTQLLKNWANILQSTDRIFVAGTYHSVPLAIFVVDYLLSELRPPNVKSVGILGIESCLQGFQFWSHNTEITSQNMENPNFQIGREKSLYEGCSKLQQANLSKIKNYRETNSSESKALLRVLDHLVYTYPYLRISLIGKLHDNFMTVTQKLAIDYIHPCIQKKIWCDGSKMGLSLPSLAKLSADKNLDSLKFEQVIRLPEEREFEVSLIKYLIMAINLGHTWFIPLLKDLSPFFISRSFSEWTLPRPLRKQVMAEQKARIQEQDTKWKDVTIESGGNPPEKIDSCSKMIEYLDYRSLKSPEELEIKNKIYDDCSIYESFILDTCLTTNLQSPKRLYLHRSDGDKILNSVNEYDLVWNLHDAMTRLMKIKNLPLLPPNESVFNISSRDETNEFSLEHPMLYHVLTDPSSSLHEIWSTYQTWKPNTTGLRQLQKIFSVLHLYESGPQLQNDIGCL